MASVNRPCRARPPPRHCCKGCCQTQAAFSMPRSGDLPRQPLLTRPVHASRRSTFARRLLRGHSRAVPTVRYAVVPAAARKLSLASGAQDDDLRVAPYFCLASDRTTLPPWRPGRASGAFQPGHHPVLVPRAHVLLEAFLRLYARDSDKKIGSFGMAMISYVEEYVDDDGLLDAEQLPEPLRTLYGDLRTGRTPVRQWTRDLKEALGVPVEDSEDD